MKEYGSLCKGAFFALLLVDLALSLQPHATLDAMYPPEVQAWDFAVHAAMYAALAGLGCMAFVPRDPGAWRGRLVAALALACLGAVLELLQATPVVARSCSLSDALHNTVGALAGAFLAPTRFLRPSAAFRGRIPGRPES